MPQLKHFDVSISTTATATTRDTDTHTGEEIDNSYTNEHTDTKQTPDTSLPQKTYKLPNEERKLDPRWTIIPKPPPKPGRWELEWVASHQDDDPNIDLSNLPTGTKLNILADELATEGLNKLHTKPKVPLDPSSAVLLHHKGSTLTRDIKRTLRSLNKLPILEQYYMKRFNWSPTTYQKIDWEIFTPVYRKKTNKNLKWMNKFCMRKLPVGERIHSRESKFEE